MDDRTHDALLCERLAETIGRDRVQAWLPSCASIAATGLVVTITAESNFLCELVRTNIGTDLGAAVRKLVGPDARVEYVTSERCKAPAHNPTVAKLAPRSACRPAPVATPQPVANDLAAASLATFVTGDANRFACEVARQVAVRGMSGSIVLLVGPCGSGKTHLLSAVRQEYRQRFPQSRSLLITAEQFTSGFLEALNGGGLPSFRQKHRGVDLLVVDDLSFFIGKRATIEELLYTIDRVIAGGGQVMIGSNRLPSELSQLGGELVSRLASALVCELSLPDVSARRQIITQLFARHSVQVATDVLDVLARGLATSVRELMGVVNRLATQHRLLGDPIDLSLAERIVGQANRHARRPVQLDDVERVVCDFFGLEPRKLRGDDRHQSVSQPRMVAMFLARKLTQAAWREIGTHFGGRSHSTVISAHRRIESQLGRGSQLRIAGQPWQLEEALDRIEATLMSA